MRFEEVMEPVPELLEATSASVLCGDERSPQPQTYCPPSRAKANWALGVFSCCVYSASSLEKQVMGS